MKRVLVLSDSHGNVGNMIRAVKREEPDMILHMGDCVVDADALRRESVSYTHLDVYKRQVGQSLVVGVEISLEPEMVCNYVIS